MGIKNKLSDLNDHLFAQLERLSDEETIGDELKEEIERSKSVTMIARTIVDNGKLVLDAAKAINDRSIVNAPKMLGISNEV